MTRPPRCPRPAGRTPAAPPAPSAARGRRPAARAGARRSRGAGGAGAGRIRGEAPCSRPPRPPPPALRAVRRTRFRTLGVLLLAVVVGGVVRRVVIGALPDVDLVEDRADDPRLHVLELA